MAKQEKLPVIHPDIWHQFTPTAVRAIQRAQDEARRLGSRTVRTHHLLLGLSRVKGIASAMLQWMELGRAKLRSEVEKLSRGKVKPLSSQAAIPLNQPAKRAIQFAVEEAAHLNPGLGLPDAYLDTGHLLLGIMRETKGQGAKIIEAKAPYLTLEMVRAKVSAALRAGGAAGIGGQTREGWMLADSYLDQVSAAIDKLSVDRIRRIADLIWNAHEKDRTIFAFGNGGSSATASHFIEDLAKGVDFGPKRRKFRALALTDSVALITAWANDTDFENIFAEQLRNFVQAGDVVMGISASGNSPNVLRGLELANQHGAITIALTGYQGGKAKDLAQETMVVPSDNMQQIEDLHLIICHQIFSYLRDRAASSR